MKNMIKLLAGFGFLLCFPLLVLGQTVDEVIDKHIEAHGGYKNWENVKALKITGKYTSFSLEKDFTSYKTKNGKYFGDLYLGEEKILESWDGQDGWATDPWQEMPYPRRVNLAEENMFMQKAEFFTPFFDYKTKGHSVEYLGKEDFDGVDCFVLKLTRNNGKFETWYLDSSTYLEYACLSEWTDFAWPMPAESFFDDFRKVEKLIIPFFIDRTFSQRNRVIQIEQIEVNPELDKAMFIMPKRKEIYELAFMEGNWKVQVETKTQMGTWFDLGVTPSKIYFDGNQLKEEIEYERIFPISKTIQYAWDDQIKKYKVVVYNDLTSNFAFFTGELLDSGFGFDDLSIVAQEGIPNKKYSVELKSKTEFSVIVSQSIDQGENWKEVDRFSYTKE